MNMTVELFDNIINTSQDCVFWKDSERRFLGVNQAFLDFYGFESASVLIGKTDEDMGWHNDPEPYKQDELRVLSGRTTYKVHGKCVVRGEERDIIASKRPLYEGDKIVGLVGSFIDITDVLRRQKRTEGQHTVYTVEKLRRIHYFDKLLDEMPLDEILDPLTGIVSRMYAMNFVHSLISAGTPFSFAIIDLDNFKYINDTFGHEAGDTVLKAVTGSLAGKLGENGIVGRFGGDELLMIDLRDTELSAKQGFFKDLYENSGVLRQDVSLDSGSTFVTCTAGCASFPEDAENYSDLFALTDKMLYLGKNKGRNCYAIYRADKHRDIEIKKLVKHNIYDDMIKLQKLFERGNTLREKMRSVLTFLTDFLQIPDLYFADSENRLRSVTDEQLALDVSDITELGGEDLYTSSDISEIEKNCPLLYDALKSRGLSSVMIIRTGSGEVTDGYLICGVKRRFRIWQENECAVLYFLSNLIRGYLLLSEKH